MPNSSMSWRSHSTGAAASGARILAPATGRWPGASSSGQTWTCVSISMAGCYSEAFPNRPGRVARQHPLRSSTYPGELQPARSPTDRPWLRGAALSRAAWLARWAGHLHYSSAHSIPEEGVPSSVVAVGEAGCASQVGYPAMKISDQAVAEALVSSREVYAKWTLDEIATIWTAGARAFGCDRDAAGLLKTLVRWQALRSPRADPEVEDRFYSIWRWLTELETPLRTRRLSDLCAADAPALDEIVKRAGALKRNDDG